MLGALVLPTIVLFSIVVPVTSPYTVMPVSSKTSIVLLPLIVRFLVSARVRPPKPFSNLLPATTVPFDSPMAYSPVLAAGP